MGFVRVEVGFSGMKCAGCDKESMEFADSMGCDYCELFEQHKAPGERCVGCIEGELRPGDLYE